jgi:ubiquinol-cytochrome c reductase cytochrome b subunit
VLTLPAVAYATTYRLCRGLQRDDLAVLEHGIETGVINRLPHGGYVEIRRPADRPGRHKAIVN